MPEPESNDYVPRMRLKEARERAGMHPQDFAQYLNRSTNSYYDLENCDDELLSNVTLGELVSITSHLAIRVKDLFATGEDTGSSISFEELRCRIQENIANNQLSISEFEGLVGWTVEPALKEPQAILNWTVDCLRAVCNQVQLDWRSVLP